MNVQISNTEPPQTRGRYKQHNLAFAELQETQSFIVGKEHSAEFPNIRAAASYYARKHNISLSCFAKEDGGLQVYRNPTGQVAIEPVRKKRSAKPAYVPPPSAAPPPPGDSLPPPVGPTHDQWVNMLARMQPPTGNTVFEQAAITIPAVYGSHFPQMQQWTRDYALATTRTYAAIVVDGQLTVRRGEDPAPAFVFEAAANIPADDVESAAENSDDIVIEHTAGGAYEYSDDSYVVSPDTAQVNPPAVAEYLCDACNGEGFNVNGNDICEMCAGSGVTAE